MTDVSSPGLPTHDPAEPYRTTLPVRPLWLGAVAGLLTGLTTTAQTQVRGLITSQPALTAALLTLVWVPGWASPS